MEILKLLLVLLLVGSSEVGCLNAWQRLREAEIACDTAAAQYMYGQELVRRAFFS